jgi:hypothetical protein
MATYKCKGKCIESGNSDSSEFETEITAGSFYEAEINAVGKMKYLKGCFAVEVLSIEIL